MISVLQIHGIHTHHIAISAAISRRNEQMQRRAATAGELS